MGLYLIYKFGGREPSERDASLEEIEAQHPGIFIYCRSPLFDPEDGFDCVVQKCTAKIKGLEGPVTFVIDRRHGQGRIGRIEETTARQSWPEATFVEIT